MEEQLELFPLNYAESGNTNQLLPVPGDEPLAGERNTDGCTFLPAAGNRNNGGTSMNNVGSNGNYWSSQQYNSSNGQNFNFNGSNYNLNNNNRNNGQSVRCCLPASTESQNTSFPVFQLSKEQLLVDLFKAYYEARRHKRNTLNQLKFEMNLEENLVTLRDELTERTYKVGRSTCFIIEDPKKREIFASDFRDRVVHHLVYNYIMPIFDSTFIDDSYSCRKGKGTLYGIHRLAHHVRSCSQNYAHDCYVMKMDIQGYFMNINRNNLLNMVNEELEKYALQQSPDGKKWVEILDYGLILFLLKEIILTDPTKNCIIKGQKSNWDGLPANKSLFHTPHDCGLPIGNLTSQLFSNIYLNKLDQFVKRKLREKHYGRYVDDFYIVSRVRARLEIHKETIREFLNEKLGLVLHPQKTKIERMAYGITYLGIYVKPHRVYLDNKTLKRVTRKVGMVLRMTDEKLLQSSVNSYLGYMKHFKCGKIKQRLFAGKPHLEHFGTFTGYYDKFCLHKPVTERIADASRIVMGKAG